MSESESLPMNFGGIDEEEYSSFDTAKVLVWPVSYEGTVSYGGGTGAGAMAIVDASRNMELYEEETDSEVYKIGIHTLPEFTTRETPEAIWRSKMKLKTHYVYSDTAAESLSDGYENGVLFVRAISAPHTASGKRVVEFDSTPLIIGNGVLKL